MSLARRSFLRALIGAPVVAKAIERIIANGAAQPAPVPVKPTVQPPYERAQPFRWDPQTYACSGVVRASDWSFTGVSLLSGQYGCQYGW